jgi:hypothetical protein
VSGARRGVQRRGFLVFLWVPRDAIRYTTRDASLGAVATARHAPYESRV